MPKKGDPQLRNRFSKETEMAVVGRFLDLVELELKGGASSQGLTFAGVNHINDILHTAGLITNDCWNNVKGMISTTTITNTAAPVLKTLVQAATGLGTKRLELQSQETQKQLEAIAAVEAADAKEDLEG